MQEWHEVSCICFVVARSGVCRELDVRCHDIREGCYDIRSQLSNLDGLAGRAYGLLFFASMGSVGRLPCRRQATCLSKQGRARRRWTLAVGAAGWLLCLAQPAVAMSPKETLEAFFLSTNSVLQSMDLTHGLEKPRQAIRDLVDDTFDFRAAAAVALGSVWSSRVPEEQEAFTRLF